MNKMTQACICVTCIVVVVVCLIVAFRKPASPDMEFLKQWEKAKQEAVEEATKELRLKNQELKEKNEELNSKINTQDPMDAPIPREEKVRTFKVGPRKKD